MAGDSPNVEGIIGSLKRLGEALLSIAQNRLELASVEFSEEKNRLIEASLLGVIFSFFCLLSLGLGTVAVVFLLWRFAGETAAMTGLIGFCLLYAGLAAATYFRLRQAMKNWPIAFESTISELKKDHACLTPKK
jgi:uncharacterized membrane protein YqjE